MALKSMSIAKLQDLKAKVDAAISEKVSSHFAPPDFPMFFRRAIVGCRGMRSYA
jgi:hypothetical protein